MDRYQFDALVKGFAFFSSLIVAIGAQNAHVLRQGLLRRYMPLTVSICIFFDILLICIGALGIGKIIAGNHIISSGAALFGAIFLGVYGYRTAIYALKPTNLEIGYVDGHTNWFKVALNTLAVTLLNPHVYLDTVVLSGSIAAQFPYHLRWYFILGEILSSTMWFVMLGFGAATLAPIFARPKAWTVLNTLIAIIMWYVSATLLFQAISTLL